MIINQGSWRRTYTNSFIIIQVKLIIILTRVIINIKYLFYQPLIKHQYQPDYFQFLPYYQYKKLFIGMSFLFKLNGMQQQKTTKVLAIMNFIQAACSWFVFIACIMIGNIKQQIKSHFNGITEIDLKTYNPLLALYSIIGIYQTLLGAFIGLILLGKLQFVNNNKKLWMNLIHYGLIFQFGFIFSVCLQASTQSITFAAINDSLIFQYYTINTNDPNFKYYEAYYVYSRYLVAWAILTFLISLPISLINLIAIHTKHVNYQALETDSTDREEVVIDPSIQSPTTQTNNSYYPNAQHQTGMQVPNENYYMQNGQPPRALEVQMIPK